MSNSKRNRTNEQDENVSSAKKAKGNLTSFGWLKEQRFVKDVTIQELNELDRKVSMHRDGGRSYTSLKERLYEELPKLLLSDKKVVVLAYGVTIQSEEDEERIRSDRRFTHKCNVVNEMIDPQFVNLVYLFVKPHAALSDIPVNVGMNEEDNKVYQTHYGACGCRGHPYIQWLVVPMEVVKEYILHYFCRIYKGRYGGKNHLLLYKNKEDVCKMWIHRVEKPFTRVVCSLEAFSYEFNKAVDSIENQYEVDTTAAICLLYHWCYELGISDMFGMSANVMNARKRYHMLDMWERGSEPLELVRHLVHNETDSKETESAVKIPLFFH